MNARPLFVLAIALSACTKGDAVRPGGIGSPAPAYSARNLDGQPVALSTLKGKVAVLNVWATWCEPCRDEIPQLEALHRQFAKENVELIGVSVDGAGMGGDVHDFMRDHDMSYTVWLDPDKQFSLQFLTVGVPETFLVDRAGVIRWHKIGALAQGDTTLASAIRQALRS
ncbi:MAG: Disulfide bond oxidoreductase family protein [Gemmatimonadetes bacterium]|nr:Disulfide bond oxidoreductase family protein [Gemmatimonadota bacterium]